MENNKKLIEKSSSNITHKDKDEVAPPFRKSSVITRTPPGKAATTSNTPVAVTAESSSTNLAASQRRANKMAAHTVPLSGPAGTPTSHQQQLVFTPKVSNGQRTLTIGNPAPKTGVLAELIKRMGKDIDGLLQYVESRRNVHGDIRKMCSIIKRAHTEVTIQLKIDERTTAAMSAPAHTRKTTAAENTATLSAKRERTKTSPNAAHGSEISPDSKRRRSKSPQNLPPKDHREKWQKVQSKKKPANNRKTSGSLRPRSDVIIIEKKEEGTTYADMLRAIKSDATLSGFGDKVRTMRPTQKGGLLIELKRNKDSESSSCQSVFKKALDGVATVNLKTHCITLQCKGLITELNSEEELLDAIAEQAQIKRPDKSAIKSMHATYGGTQSVYISLHAVEAKKVLALGSLKVGWVRCRVSEVISPKRCHRCWSYDHVATVCKSYDRTKLCRRCGEDGHMAASCRNAEKCALCDGAHKAGSTKCPRYQEAVRKIKR